MRFTMPFPKPEQAREEFCLEALGGALDMRELCHRHGISPTIGYKWLGRYRREGVAGLADRSRRPHGSPLATRGDLEEAVLAVRRENPTWGGRKIAASLSRAGIEPPAASTITAILHRRGAALAAAGKPRTWKRFEHAAPNSLWQMDFKGHVAMRSGRRLHPLTVLDDHSRYAVVLHAADNERTETVQAALRLAFQRHGMPWAILTDNGSPWGNDADNQLTRFGVWLIEHGVEPWHTAPYHPQTNGKCERFNGTLDADVLKGRVFEDLDHAQPAFDGWRHHYNHRRPHQAIGMAVPADRYVPSPRPWRDAVEPFDHAPGDIVRSVDLNGVFSLDGRLLKASRALHGKRVALRHTDVDGILELRFRHVPIKNIDLRT